LKIAQVARTRRGSQPRPPMRDKTANVSVTSRLTGVAQGSGGKCVKYFVMFRESGTERRAMPRSVKMKLHREA
jgi:hypothetical protein